jgi:hypothetical protein
LPVGEVALGNDADNIRVASPHRFVVGYGNGAIAALGPFAGHWRGGRWMAGDEMDLPAAIARAIKRLKPASPVMSRTLLSAVRRGAVLHPITALGTSLERRTKCANMGQWSRFIDRLRTVYYQTDVTLRGLV